MEKFILIAEARSGTHFLQSALNSHPDIHSFMEIFPSLDSADYHRYWLDRIKADETSILPHNQSRIFDTYLDHLFSTMPEKMVLGMDIKYHQLDWIPYRGTYSVLVRRQDIKVIHLIRQNLLKLYLSAIFNAHKEKLNRGNHTTKAVAPATATIEPANMIAFFKTISTHIAEKRNFFSTHMDYLEIYYENCFDNPSFSSETITPYVLDQIYEFLNIEDKRYNLHTDLVEMNPPRIQDMISNYDEVVDALTNTEWEYLLDDTLGMVRGSLPD